MERPIVFVFSLIAICFSVSAFFVSNDTFLFGLLDFVSLILLAFALKFYKDGKHNYKHSFVNSFNQIGHTKSVCGLFGIVYLIAILSTNIGINNNLFFFGILIIFTMIQIFACLMVLSVIIWD